MKKQKCKIRNLLEHTKNHLKNEQQNTFEHIKVSVGFQYISKPILINNSKKVWFRP
jgi:hypothetical protein